jgi:HEAT repeat protein
VYHYGHLSRNDRTFLPNSIKNKSQLIGSSIATLLNHEALWPDTMMAALTIKSLWSEPAARAAVPVLIQHLAKNRDFDIRWRVAGTLGKLPHPNGVNQLIEALNDPSFYVRDEAAWALAEIGDMAAARLLERISSISDAERPLAALALGRSGNKTGQQRGLEIIRHGLIASAGTLQLNYAYSAGEMAGVPGAATLLPQLATLLGATSADMRAVAAWALGSLAADYHQDAGWTVLTTLADRDEDPLVRTEAVIALGKSLMFSVNPRAIQALSKAVADRDSRVRYAAVQSSRLLAECTELIVPMTRASVCDEDNGVRLELEFFEARLAQKNSLLEVRRG